MSFVLPTTVRVDAGPGVGDFHVRHEQLSESQAIQELTLFLERELSARIFVFGLLIGVLLFGAVVASVIAIEAGAPSTAGVRNVIIGITGAALALLPLRSVLVPSDLEGQTLVDWMLGAGVLCLCGVAMWWLPRALR